MASSSNEEGAVAGAQFATPQQVAAALTALSPPPPQSLALSTSDGSAALPSLSSTGSPMHGANDVQLSAHVLEGPNARGGVTAFSNALASCEQSASGDACTPIAELSRFERYMSSLNAPLSLIRPGPLVPAAVAEPSSLLAQLYLSVSTEQLASAPQPASAPQLASPDSEPPAGGESSSFFRAATSAVSSAFSSLLFSRRVGPQQPSEGEPPPVHAPQQQPSLEDDIDRKSVV
jgi:hypothetical protein